MSIPRRQALFLAVCLKGITGERYFKMNKGLNDCTDGLESMTYSQCDMYANSIDFEEFSEDESYYGYIKNNTSSPKGCHIHNLLANSEPDVYFNENPIGGSDCYRCQPICVLQENYLEMEWGATDCAKGKRMNYNQCEAYAAYKDHLSTFRGYYNDGEYYQYYKKNTKKLPSGCLLREDGGIYYNVNRKSRRGDRVYLPVCIGKRPKLPTSPKSPKSPKSSKSNRIGKRRGCVNEDC